MRILIFYCLLLASIAAASPNGRNKRHLSYLKNLVKSAIFGRSKINIQSQTDVNEENGYKLFRIPGYDDIMIKVSPKKPVIEEFVYPAAVEKVNLNAFGSVVGTETQDDTLVAVKGVNNLLSTGILYGGHNNVMKENVVPMFPSLNTPNYVVEENIETAPVIRARPVLKEVIESRPVLNDVFESRPILTEVFESRPVHKGVIEKRPVFTEVFESRPVHKEVIEKRPVFTEVFESRPVHKEVIEKRPVFTEVFESRPVHKEVIEKRPVFTEVFESRPVHKEVIEKRPVFTEAFESRPVHKEAIEERPVFTELIESRPLLKEVIETKPVFTEVIRPLEERVELKVPFEPTYSYKQMQNNEAVMTYTAHNNPGVEVLETLKMKTELPMCIKKRVDEAIVLGADPNRFAPVQEVFQYQSQPVVDFSYPINEANSFVQSADSSWFAPVQELHQHQPAPFIDFSYPSADTNSYVQNTFREEFADFGFSPQRLRPIQDSPVRYNLGPRKTQAINPRPVPLHSHKSLHYEADINSSKDKVNWPTRKVKAFNNLGEKVDIAQTLGPIPPQYITHVANKTENVAEFNEKIVKQFKAVPIVGSKDNIVNAKIPVNVYKSQSNPNTGKLVKETQPPRTNVETSFNESVATRVIATKKDNAEVKNVVFTNKVTAKPPSVTHPVIVASTNAPKQQFRENIQTAFKSTPVVVRVSKSYSYQQKHADGSSTNVKGNKDGVAVNVKENNNRSRGDIPD